MPPTPIAARREESEMPRLTVIALALLLAGCLVGPDYRPPRLDLPQGFRFREPETTQPADTAWWRQFGDPVLDDLIAEALAGNKNLQTAAANVEQAAAVLTQVRAPLFPQLSYAGSALRERGSETTAVPIAPSIANPQSVFQLLAGASLELDLWGRVRRLSESARANLLATVEARRGVVLTLVASVANGYLQLRGLDEQLAIARRNLAAYADSVRLFELQFQHGQIPLLNLEQARTQYETAAAAIPQIETEIVQTENALAILLGRYPGPVPRGKDLYHLTLPAIPAGLPSQLLDRRPDLLQAEQNLIAANARIGAAQALYFPAISLTGSYGYQSEHLSNLFKGPSRAWSYSGSFTGPIFTAGAISGSVEEAKAIRRGALLQYRAAIQSAFADVENALIVRRKTAEQIEAQRRLVTASQEYERLAQLQYDGGYAPYLTVLSAQQQLFPAELNLAQIRTALCISYVNLYKAMGGGWVTRAEQMTGAAPTETRPGAGSEASPPTR
jgi:outer membrane protein, multidrug efflux system